MIKKLLLCSVVLLSFASAQRIDPSLYDKAAEGDLSSMTEIGKIYNQNRQENTAKIWWRKAAVQNDAEAQYLLGKSELYKNESLAKTWLEKAAAQNYAPAQLELAGLYFYEKDNVQALNLVQQAADQGYSQGEMALGIIYLSGRFGIEKDLLKAKEYLEKAVAQEDTEAYYYMGDYYRMDGDDQDYSKAREWYQKSADDGNKYGTAALANMYILGDGVEKDHEKALSLIKATKSLYFPHYYYNMGLIYHASDDLKEQKKSLGYLRKACWMELQESCDKVQEILGGQTNEE